MRSPLPATQLLDTRVIYKDWLGLRLATLRLPDGAEVIRHIVELGPSVSVLPYDPVAKVVLLVTQPRAPVIYNSDESVFEAPAGGVDDLDVEAAVRAEALEEVGVKLGRLEHIASVYGLPAYNNEKATLFLAEYAAADRVSLGGGDWASGEFIDVHEVSFERLRALVSEGAIRCAKTLALSLSLMLRRPSLFENLVGAVDRREIIESARTSRRGEEER